LLPLLSRINELEGNQDIGQESCGGGDSGHKERKKSSKDTGKDKDKKKKSK